MAQDHYKELERHVAKTQDSMSKKVVEAQIPRPKNRQRHKMHDLEILKQPTTFAHNGLNARQGIDKTERGHPQTFAQKGESSTVLSEKLQTWKICGNIS